MNSVRIFEGRFYITRKEPCELISVSGERFPFRKENTDTYSLNIEHFITDEFKIIDNLGNEIFLVEDKSQLFLTDEQAHSYRIVSKSVAGFCIQTVPYRSTNFTGVMAEPLIIGRKDNELATINLNKTDRNPQIFFCLGEDICAIDFLVDHNYEVSIAQHYVTHVSGRLIVFDGVKFLANSKMKHTEYHNLEMKVTNIEVTNESVVLTAPAVHSMVEASLLIGERWLFGKVKDGQITFKRNFFPELCGKVKLYLGNQQIFTSIKKVFLAGDNVGEDLLIENNELYLLKKTKTPASFTNQELKKHVKIKFSNLELTDYQLSFQLERHLENAQLIINKRGQGLNYILPLNNKDDYYYCSLRSFIEDEAAELKKARFDFYLYVFSEGQYQLMRLANKDKLPKDKKNRFFGVVTYGQHKTAYSQHFELYLTNSNTLSLVKNNLSNLAKERYEIKTQVADFVYKKPKVRLTCKLETKNKEEISVQSVLLVKRNKDTLERIKITDFTIDQKKNHLLIKTTIDLSIYDFEPLYWDLYVETNINEQRYFVRINKASKAAKRNIRSNTLKYQYHTQDDFLMYPYITISEDISFTYRKRESYETKWNNFKEKSAYYLARLMKPYFAKKDIWIGFEKLASSAHDSGYHFFNYCYENKKHDQFYYVIDKYATEAKFLADKKDRTLNFMSFKYFLYLFSSTLLISSDTKRNVYNLKQKETYMGRVLTEKPLAYLQHGVNGLKKVPDFYKNRNVFDLVIVPSEYEKRLVINEWGYEEEEVAVTGLARWDVMRDRTTEIPYRQIFVMPTWRTWMDGLPKEKFIQTDYFKEYSQFLASKELKELLVANNVRIAFFLHPKFKEYIDLFEIDPEIIDKYEFLEVPMDELIMKSSMMISDYSSVIWEMYYLKKPCVFFQFDIEKYLQYEGLYMDPKTDLFGDVAYTSDKLIALIQETIKNGFVEKDIYANMRKEYFSLMDHDNSKRIYEAIVNSNVKSKKNGGIRPITKKTLLKIIKRK
ncbi:CDP-glycerol glycerophosphotransferase family protein [Enterococcus thailandicus]|uniref:CDP-glycerol glycerophosphotransferase family protein n=1 Tax=Enterococcus thailandicus TaxID=417368 RepID=UPI0022E7DDFA|nr:CDP-glycerol glycerophosphotransferase family protein [Enterococcus thailandicus]